MLTKLNNPLLAEPEPPDITFNPDEITVPGIFKTTVSKSEIKKIFREKSAAEAIGPIIKNMHMFGLTKAQFSIIDILKHVLQEIGPSSLSISTWTSATSDLHTVKDFLNSGMITNLRFLIDFSFQRRSPEIINEMRKNFGLDSIRVTRNHAKFYLIQNDDWNLVIRTSMNLNFNPRIEDFTLEDNPDLFNFLDDFLNDIFQTNATPDQTTKWHLNNFRKMK